MVSNQKEFDEKYSKKEKEIRIKSEDFKGQLVINNYPKLAKLYLRDIEKIEKITLLNLCQLQECTIWNCGLTDLVIENCPQIKKINVRSNYLTNLEFLKSLPNLKELEVDGNTELIKILAPYYKENNLDWKTYQKVIRGSNKNVQELPKDVWDLKEKQPNEKDLLSEVEKTKQEIQIIISKDDAKGPLTKKIKKIEDEVEEIDNIIHQKVLKHIFNNYDDIIKVKGGNIFIDSVVGDNNDSSYNLNKLNPDEPQIKREELEKKLQEKRDNDHSYNEQLNPKEKKNYENWKNIDLNFTAELQKKWEDRGFDYEETKEWIDIGLAAVDTDYAQWLRDTKKVDSDWVLNHGNIELLRKEYSDSVLSIEEDSATLFDTLRSDTETLISLTNQPSILRTSGGLGVESAKAKAFKKDESLKHGTPSKKEDRRLPHYNSSSLTQTSFSEAREALSRAKMKVEEMLKLVKHDYYDITKAQEWLEKYYPDKETRTIYLNQQLAGVLDCSEYKNLWNIFISSSIDSSKSEIKKGSYREWSELKETKIIPCPFAQTWLDQNYPKNGTCQIEYESYNINNFGKTRKEITELKIWNKGLEGNLDLFGFKNLEELDCRDNYLTNLNLNNYKKLKKIECSNNQLTTLNLSNLAELEELYCSDNYLTQIPYFPQPENITWLDIRNNNLSPSNLTIFSQFRNLGGLGIDNSYKIKINQNIYNRFTGNLEPFKDLSKLWWLSISNTDLDSGWEYLPDSLEYFHYDTELRPNCQLAQIEKYWDQELWKDIHQDFAPKWKKEWLDAGFNKEQTKEWIAAGAKPDSLKFINWFLNFRKLDLDWARENEEEFRDLRNKYKHFGTCKECQQPNTSQFWCQTCNSLHFAQDFYEWTSDNKEIDKFIRKCQIEATSPWNVLEWIPYEQFKNIEPIAQGGFGKIEKAEWEGGHIGRWDNEKKRWERKGDYETGWKDYKTVALKTLSNSQNLNQDFLQELVLYKMFRSEVSNMVPCYGVSWEPDGNYILVMKYMKEGNLREFLRKNYRELKFYNNEKPWKNSKLRFLQQITQGLKDIHRKQLVHRDFHSGNIVVDDMSCHITDLGLSQPVNEVKKEGKIYGLMPYTAPEVLMGQPYTQKADIYSLGMIMYEVITCLPPFYDQDHDVNLALKIIQGIRPQFPKQVKYPPLLVDLIKQCWDSEPNNRPTAREISEIVGGWFNERGYLKTDTEFYYQIQAVEDHNKTLPKEIKYPTYHSLEVWHSKPINTKQITELLTSQAVMALDLSNLDIQDPHAESSTQAQIEIPPKK